MAWSTSKHRGSTRQSRTIRAQVLRDCPTCYLQHPGCTQTSTEDDHITPIHLGGTDHPTNRAGACHHCHTIKTWTEAQAARRAASRSARRPIESHPGLRHTE